MTGSKRLGSLLEATGVIIAVGLISTSATFAALQSPAATLSANTINVGAADLRISTNGTTFTVPSTAGFSFNGVVPGGGEVPASGNLFYLKNYGTSNSLDIRVAINTTPTNLSNIDLSKVYFSFTRIDSPEPEVSIPLQTLISAKSTGGVDLGDTLAAGSVAQYALRVSMDASAYSGSGANVSISGIDLAFTGVGI